LFVVKTVSTNQFTSLKVALLRKKVKMKRGCGLDSVAVGNKVRAVE
jgi:hypothetical protein